MDTETFYIPTDNKLLAADILKRKLEYVDHVLHTMKHRLEENISVDRINIFKFKNTNLEVIIKKESYIANLENLLDYYIKEELYEQCRDIKLLITNIETNTK